ncbi:MAG: hypothetical protein LBQ66_12905 [Planctomycetaceae bacterium]|jgi:hypothetical protein|nr:hypothetical protein [Planctomycetaceae bacterium]
MCGITRACLRSKILQENAPIRQNTSVGAADISAMFAVGDILVVRQNGEWLYILCVFLSVYDVFVWGVSADSESYYA